MQDDDLVSSLTASIVAALMRARAERIQTYIIEHYRAELDAEGWLSPDGTPIPDLVTAEGDIAPQYRESYRRLLEVVHVPGEVAAIYLPGAGLSVR